MDAQGFWDWDEMLALAFSIGLLPREFWAMTFREFYNCIEGHRRREALDIDKRDWELRTQVGVWSKRRILPGELSGKRRPEQEVEIVSAEQFHAEAQRRQALAAERKEARRGNRRR